MSGNFEDSIRVKVLEKELYDNNNKLRFLEQANDRLIEQKRQLKELLKECRDDVNHIISNVHLCKELLDLKTKIDNAIGEK